MTNHQSLIHHKDPQEPTKKEKQNMKNQITHKVNTHSVRTTIPIEHLARAYNKLFEDILDEPEEGETDLTHTECTLSETSGPLAHFGINRTLHIPTLKFLSSLTIYQWFESTPPPDYLELLITQLNLQSDIVNAASTMLDQYVDLDQKDREDFMVKAFTSNPKATTYFIRFQQFEGEDTAFDYHSSYTAMILEALVEALSPGT